MGLSKTSLASILFMLLICMGLLASAHEDVEAMLVGRRLQGSPFGCEGKCNIRCSKSSRYKLCYKDCYICCNQCNGCVPPGTAGNREMCPCYASIKNSKGTGKCP